MESLYNVNGLMFWTEKEIRLRNQFTEHFSNGVRDMLLVENPAWRFTQVEGPLLTPRPNINDNYTNDDVWVQEDVANSDAERQSLNTQIASAKLGIINSGDDITKMQQLASLEKELKELDDFEASADNPELVLRPETTPSSYVYARHLLDSQCGVKPPFVVWQAGKSFRREQEQVTKNMRLKEFYQQEFQCVYTAETMNDYQEAVLEPVRKMIGEMTGLPTRLVESDRLPSYSLRTMDVEVWCQDPITASTSALEASDIPNTHDGRSGIPDVLLRQGRWMEICSISKRTDFPGTVKFTTKKGTVEKELQVLEIAIGLDRAVYSFMQRVAE